MYFEVRIGVQKEAAFIATFLAVGRNIRGGGPTKRFNININTSAAR